MRMRAISRVVLCVLWASAAAAQTQEVPGEAEPTDDPTRIGFYAGLGAVYAFENFSFDSDNLGLSGILGPGVDPKYDDSAGAHLQLGYRVEPWLGIEFLYEFLEGFDSTAGIPETEIDSHLFTLNAKWYPRPGRLEPYLLAGMGAHLVNSEVRDSAVKKPFETDLGFVGRLGGGLAYQVTTHFGMELEGSYQLGHGGMVQYARYGTLALHFIYRR